jgi:beta-1,4-N-acetylglucosaminyltransferase
MALSVSLQVLDSREFLELLKSKGYTGLLVQMGDSKHEPANLRPEGSAEFDRESFPAFYYRFKSSIADDLKRASLVISHAGSGSILETLSLNKPLVVVVNTQLMDNHQAELATQLDEMRFVLTATCASLITTLTDK